MRGIKIPQQYFALKTQGGLMREGERTFRTLRYKSIIVGSKTSTSKEPCNMYCTCNFF